MNAITKSLLKVSLSILLVTGIAAQSNEIPLSDSRLTVHTLVREDIFAGFLANDLDRLARAEKHLDLLLDKRPAEKQHALAWKAGATLYRAVVAHEANQEAEFKSKYEQARALFAQASAAGPADNGVAAVTGGSYVLFGDRLPAQYRKAAWNTAYDSFALLWKQQAPAVDRLPVHIRGELLGGLTQSAQRTGRQQEFTEYLDKILLYLRDTPYESVAKKWKENPAVAATENITCKTCHEPGRLTARLAGLNK
jgi:hypothetical protein